MAEKKTTTTKAPKVTKKVQEVKTLDQLQTELFELQTAYVESQKSHRAGELVNPRVLTVQRKDIARLHTAIALLNKAAKEEN